MRTTPGLDSKRRCLVPGGRAALLGVLALIGGNPPGQGREDETYRQTFDQLRSMTPRADRVVTVKDLVLKRDVAEFQLDLGTLYLLTPVGDRTIGAVFVGTGRVTFQPPLKIERDHMQRVLEDSAFDATPISAAVFLFADSTLAELESRLSFGAGSVAGAAQGPVSDALDYLTDGGGREADFTLMDALLNRRSNGFFAAFLKRQRGEHVMIMVDPQQAEEILLLRRGRQRGQRVETVAQFQRAEELAQGLAVADEHPDPINLKGYRIDVTIKGNMGFSAQATVGLAGRRDSVSWVPFILLEDLQVDSVLDDDHSPTAFFRGKRSRSLWVRLGHPLTPGATHAVRIAYHGDLLSRGSLMRQYMGKLADTVVRRRMTKLDSWVFIKSAETWFPRYGQQPAEMDLTYHTPKGYRFVSIGRLTETRDEGSVHTTHWVTELPTTQASFNIGDFDEFQITDPRIPPVTVHLNREAHRSLGEVLLGQRDPEREVGSDVANSLAFFTRAFGAPLFGKYYATEIPGSYGQAFPGLMYLSWWTFQSVDDRGWEEIFRAHEMAHQWWGIGVEPAAYRDAWLSEGFAMFAGAWYMQLILEDNEKFFKQLKDWRERIRGVRKHAPPVGLGWRIAQNDWEQYDLIVYRKGAWVLQMLRNMMLDFRTMKEDRFQAMMREFYETYRGRRASTKDFQRVVEKHLGQPMDWFFDEWVDGTAVPTYTYSWQAERAAEAQYRLRLKVRQEDVPDDFRMAVPVTVELANGDHAVLSVMVHGPLTEQQWTLPAEPTQVTFNPLESVLAEVKQESWR